MPILVVEDDTEIRTVICALLEDEGYTVAEAINGQEALLHLERVRPLPCMIVLDLMMPIMNGWEFLQVRQHTPPLLAIPTVVISAARPLGSPAVLGVQEVLPKPLDFDRLATVVQQYCG